MRIKLIFGACLVLAAPVAHSAEIQVVVSGKYKEAVDAYRVGSTYYLDAQVAGSIYGGSVYWYPVAGRVQMSLRGNQIRFLVNSNQAQLGSQNVTLSQPVIARTTHAFIPLDFFLSGDFSDLAEMDSQFDKATQLLTVDRRTTVGPLRWLVYPDFTRVEIDLGKYMGYTFSRRGKSGCEATFPFGQLAEPQSLAAADGGIAELKLRQEPKGARLSIRFAPGVAGLDENEELNPKRLVINIYRSAAALRAGARKLAKTEQAKEFSVATPGSAPGASAVTIPIGKVEPNVEASTAPFVASATSGTAVSVAVSSRAPQASRPLAAAPSTAPAPAPERPKPRIVVDAGHGGKDSGAKGRHGVREKDINLKAALELAALLRQNGMFDVLLIRDDDTFVPLDERSSRANEFKADLFISLHCNAASRRAENGFEIYFLSEHASDPESQRVAAFENSALQLEGRTTEEDEAADVLHAMAKTEYINDSSEVAGFMSEELSKREHLFNRGAKQAAFYVLRGTYSPAVLVEMAFVTNSKDAANLQSKKFRRKIIDGIYSGILDFGKIKNWNLTPDK